MLSEVKLKSGGVAKIGDVVHVSIYGDLRPHEVRKGKIIGFANRIDTIDGRGDYDIARTECHETCAILEMEDLPDGYEADQCPTLSRVFTLNRHHRLWNTNYIVEVLETGVSETSMHFDLRRYYAAMGQPMPAFEDDAALKRVWSSVCAS